MSKKELDYIPECEIEGRSKPLTAGQTRDILMQIEKKICDIKLPNSHGTGFFCNIPFNDFDKENTKNKIPVLITNHHVLSQDYLDESEVIEFTLNENKIKKEIKLTNKRRIYSNEEYDITIIELNPEEDSIESNSFFEVDPKISSDNPQKKFKDIEVYIIGNIDKISNGLLNRIYEDGIKLEYFFSTEPGMSGSPIINLNNYKVIGVHKGASLKKKSNYGIFLRKPIIEFYKKNKNFKIIEKQIPTEEIIDVKPKFAEKLTIENNEFNIETKPKNTEKLAFKSKESNNIIKDIISTQKLEDKQNNYIKQGEKSYMDIIIKICLFGKLSSEKSKIIFRFINYEPPDEQDPTIEDRYTGYINIEGKDYKVEILDTGGEEDYQNMIGMWISFGDGFLLVFDITDYESFEYIKGKYKRILMSKHGEKVPIILVGNKKELENKRKVSFEEAKKLADCWGIEYIETSAKENLNCYEVFEKLSKEILKNYSKNKKKIRKGCNIY